MLEFFRGLWDTQGFRPPWEAGPWQPGHIWLHVLSDLATGAAYTATAAILAYFVHRRPNLPFPRLIWLFAAFILACGTVHLLEAGMFWWPAYRLAGLAKFIAACVSWVTLVVLIPTIPRALALRTPAELERVIKQREQAEQRLRESEALYQSLVESLPLSVFHKDAQFRIVFGNQRFCETVGLPLEQIQGKTDYDLFPAERAEKYRRDDLRILELGATLEDVEMLTRAGGAEIYVQVLKAPLRNHLGETVGIQGMFWDVTARKRVEEALVRSDSRFRRLLESNVLGIYTVDFTGRVLEANDAFLNAVGYTREDLQSGRVNWQHMTPPEYRELDQRAIERLRECGACDPWEKEYIRGDGTRVPILLGVTMLDDARADCLCFMIDMTDRRRAESALRESEARLRAVFDAALDCIVFTDALGRIVEFNRAAERTFGYRRKEALGRELTELVVPPDERERHRGNLARYAGGGEVGSLLAKRLEFTNVRKDGSQFIAEMAMQPIPLQGTPGFAVFVRDITERRKAEEALRSAKEAAEEASRAKSLFLANMSHEIRTPMNAILGMTDVLLDTQVSAEQREYLNMVQQSGEALLDVIADILDFSKIEAGRLDLDRATFSLRDCLGDALKSVASVAHKKGLELVGHVRPDVPDTLRGDAGRLRQILLNLVGNAIKFTERGEVVIDVVLRELTSEPSVLAADEDDTASLEPSAELEFSVTDTGIGIASHRRAAVFQAFEQADNSITRRFGGTGLGLAICSKLVELMGGRIELNSAEGQGTTFRFTARFELVEKSQAQQNIPAILGDLRALIVDDNARSQRALADMAGNWRLSADVVESATEALESFDKAAQGQRPYRCVLTSQRLKDRDGVWLAEELARRQPAPGVILMLRTGELAGESPLHGVAGVVYKPVKQSELLDAIMEAVGERGIAPEPAGDPLQTTLRPLRVLLAEDSLVNQKLASAMLRRWGHEVVVAQNGREAVELFTQQPFDLVLMDVQMPELDGLAATGEIRRLEAGQDSHVPIVAMTAHAMVGDREQCLAAGMDAYIAKPIRAHVLLHELETLLGEKVQRSEPQLAAATGAAVNWEVARRTVQGDEDLLRGVAEAFLEESPRLVQQLQTALASADAVVVRRAAHTLKSSLRYFGAESAAQAAFQVEQLGQRGELAEAGQIVPELSRQVAAVASELAARYPPAA